MPDLLSRLFGGRRGAKARWIDADGCQRDLAADGSVMLIDVRGPDEFNAPPGHLPGAINIPLAELPGRVSDIAAQARPVVLVCKTDRRSATAAETLLAAGICDVSVLRGGTDGWHQRCLPLATSGAGDHTSSPGLSSANAP